MIVNPEALLIAGAILIVIIALSWYILWYGKSHEKTIKPINFYKKNGK